MLSCKEQPRVVAPTPLLPPEAMQPSGCCSSVQPSSGRSLFLAAALVARFQGDLCENNAGKYDIGGILWSLLGAMTFCVCL